MAYLPLSSPLNHIDRRGPVDPPRRRWLRRSGLAPCVRGGSARERRRSAPCARRSPPDRRATRPFGLQPRRPFAAFRIVVAADGSIFGMAFLPPGDAPDRLILHRSPPPVQPCGRGARGPACATHPRRRWPPCSALALRVRGTRGRSAPIAAISSSRLTRPPGRGARHPHGSGVRHPRLPIGIYRPPDLPPAPEPKFESPPLPAPA